MKNKNNNGMKIYVLLGQVYYENTDVLGVYSSKEDAQVAADVYAEAAKKDWDDQVYDMCKYDRYIIEEKFLNASAI